MRGRKADHRGLKKQKHNHLKTQSIRTHTRDKILRALPGIGKVLKGLERRYDSYFSDQVWLKKLYSNVFYMTDEVEIDGKTHHIFTSKTWWFIVNEIETLLRYQRHVSSISYNKYTRMAYRHDRYKQMVKELVIENQQLWDLLETLGEMTVDQETGLQQSKTAEHRPELEQAKSQRLARKKAQQQQRITRTIDNHE